jgi:hypothetical protein
VTLFAGNFASKTSLRMLMYFSVHGTPSFVLPLSFPRN